MDNFRLWYEGVQIYEGDKIAIYDNGDFQIGDYDMHAEMPGYDEAKHIFHGFMFPSRRQLMITDFYVPGSGPGSNRSQEAVNFYGSVRKNIVPTIEPAIKEMLRERVISPQWNIKSIWNGQNFKVSEMDSQKPLSTQQVATAEKQWTADREEEGKKLGASYNQKDPKVLFKNKEKNPEAWFNRYGESTQQQIQWQDFEENPLEGPGEGEDCVAVLSDGSRVVFDFTGGGHVKITYPRKADNSQLRQCINAFADTNPEEKLDGMYLEKFLDFYKEVGPSIYKRFEPQPGDRMGEIDIYEPEKEPNLSDYMMRRSYTKYPDGATNEINRSTGYVLADGRTVTMGRGNNRDDDHRNIIPSQNAMTKWGWPKFDTETEKMQELMRKTGAVRIIVGEPFVINLTRPMTKAQKSVIRNYIENNRVKEVLVSFVGGREYEFSTTDHRQMDRYL